MNILVEELVYGIPDGRQLARAVIRLSAALILGAIIGFQRQHAGKPAGLRTHMLVCLGAALFVVVPSQIGMGFDGLSRIIQGLATGIGFIGGGAILKLYEEKHIQGITTAAGIWMTAAVGVSAGLGALGIAIFSVGLTWIILGVIGRFEHYGMHMETDNSPPSTGEKPLGKKKVD